MKVVWKSMKYRTIFMILTIMALVLLTVSFIIPPSGVIDPTILAACGEIAGFFALWVVVMVLEKSVGTKQLEQVKEKNLLV